MPGVLVDSNVLPDVLAVSGLSLLTRDPVRYRTYFPKLRLIAPSPAGPSPV